MTRKVRFIRQYLFFYLLSLLVPLAMGISFYAVVYRQEYARIESETVKSLTDGLDRLAQALTDADRLASQLLTNRDLMGLVRTEDLFARDHIYRAAIFVKDNSLIPPNLLNECFAGYYLIDCERGYVLSKDLVSTVEGFFRYDFRNGTLGPGEYLSFLGGVVMSGVYPEAALVPIGAKGRYLPYIHRFTDSTGYSYFVLVLLDVARIESYFSGIDGFNRGSFVLRQRSRVWIDAHISGERLSEGRMVRESGSFLTKVSLPSYGLEVEIAQPADLISRKISFVPFVTVLGMGAFLILGALFLVYLAYRSSRPLLHLLEQVRGEENYSGRDVVGKLTDWVEEIQGKTVRLEDLLAEQRTKLKTSVLSSMLNGTIANPSQVPTLFKHSGIDLPNAGFITILVQLREDENALIREWEHAFPVSLLSLQRRIYESHGPQAFIIQTALNEICILVNAEEHSIDALRDRLAAVTVDWVSRELQCSYLVGISKFHHGWQDVHRCLKESRSALVYDWPYNENQVNLYVDDADRGDDDVYFPQQLENGALEAIRTGRQGDLQKSLELINRENMERRKLTHYAQSILVSRYQDLLIKASQDRKGTADPLLEEVDRLVASVPQDLGRFVKETEACLLRLAERFRTEQTRKEKADAERLREYLGANFADNQLSLVSASDALGLTASYINQIIKKYSGKTFRTYMEDLRMELVRDLILKTGTPIHLLIERGGYNSMNTFCKAFKRKYGYSATSLRGRNEKETSTR